MSKWPMVKLGDAFDLQMGKTPSRANADYWRGGTNNWVSIGDISSFGKMTKSTKERITDIAISESGIKAVPENTLIMSFKLSIGKVAITSERIFTNEAIMAFLDKKAYDIDLDYMYYLLSSWNWGAGQNRAVMGQTLNKATLKNVKVPVPPMDIQRLVSMKLTRVNMLLECLMKQLEHYDLLVKSRYLGLKFYG